jgi:copper type II ascorbate-dependent monooxygenase-like protein
VTDDRTPTPPRPRPSRLGVLAVAVLGAIALPVLGVALLGGGRAEAGTVTAPSFTRDVAPIVREKCAGCHRLGGIAPFAFRTAHDVSSKASLIAAAVESRKMPPWPPGPRSARFAGQDSRILTPSQRETILRWVKTGARVDGSRVGAPKPAATAPRRGETVLRLAVPKPYTPRSTGGSTDDYRCFMLDPKLSNDVFVTSARIDPDQAALVHHVILFRVPSESVANAEALDRASAGPGWSCFGGTGISTPGGTGAVQRTLDNAPWIAAWAPGWGGNRLPDGVGVPLTAGSRVVMQVHYNLLNGQKPDRSRAVLTTVPAATGLTPLETMLLPAPVELPCAKGESGPLCDRTAALFDEARKYGQDAALIPVGLLLLCGKDAASPPAGPVTFCDRRLNGPATIYAVAGHMHLLGRSVRVELNPGTSRAKVLLDIPRWDFHWQAAYSLATPVRAQAGDVLRVTCRHDVSLRKNATSAAARKPRYILWGEGTTDEMCLGVVQVTRG